jgi:threonine/homoserine/homoserine lactone efflux protein
VLLVNADAWLAFAAASFIIGVIPGPGVATIIGIAFAAGRRSALAAVAGMALGNAMAITLSLAGAGLVLATSALAFTALKWAGAVYLIAIGLLAIWRSGRGPEGGEAPRGDAIGPRGAFLTTLAVGTFHPKTILFFIAFASQFISEGGSYWSQAAVLIATFTIVAAVTDTLYALLAARASGLLRGERMRRWAQRAGGGAMIAAGVATAAMRR